MWDNEEDVEIIELNNEIELLPKDQSNKPFLKEELCKDMLSKINENVNYLHLQTIKLNDNQPEVDVEYKVVTNKPKENYAIENIEIKKQIKQENEDEIQNSIITIHQNNIRVLNNQQSTNQQLNNFNTNINLNNYNRSNSTSTTTNSSYENLESINRQDNAINLHPFQSTINCNQLNSTNHYFNENQFEDENKKIERKLLKKYLGDSVLNNHVKPIVKYDLNKKFSGDLIYPICSKPRGYCLIINNVEFSKVYEKRKGSDLEADYLMEIFKQLGFQILYYRNSTAEAMLEHFKNVVKSPELEKHDTFVSIILTHGDDSRVVVGTDATRLKVDTFLNCFTNENCPQLIDKPKLFFIQACRGNNHDFGIYGSTNYTVSDAAPVKTSMSSIRKEIKDSDKLNDVVIVNSTLEGFVSLRNEISGSWFGDALGYALCEHSKDLELQQLLSFVNRKIVEREKGDVQQAIECNYIGIRKKFYFNPGHFFNKSNK